MTNLVSTTVVQKSLMDLPTEMFEDGFHPGLIADAVFAGDMTDADAIIEWAARVCYKSNENFGHNENFVAKLAERGHLDVLEHAYASFSFVCLYTDSIYPNLIDFQIENKYLDIDYIEEEDRLYIIISGNIRAWYESFGHIDLWTDLIGDKQLQTLFRYLVAISPNVFANNNNGFIIDENCQEYKIVRDYQYDMMEQINVEQKFAPDVIMLSMSPNLVIPDMGNDISHATFQIDNVSRSFTHQHVRHRLLSHSQESQRYVDMNNFEYVMPKDFSDEQRYWIDANMKGIKSLYYILRSHGARKEDARCILPNCTTTKIITSGDQKGWRHYIKLRDAKDAQNEIQVVAHKIRELLNE